MEFLTAILCVVFVAFSVWILNLLMVTYGAHRGWFDEEQPRKERFYHKWQDRMFAWYFEQVELIYGEDGISKLGKDPETIPRDSRNRKN